MALPVRYEGGVTPNDSARYQADTVNVGLGHRYDVVWTAYELDNGWCIVISRIMRPTAMSNRKEAEA